MGIYILIGSLIATLVVVACICSAKQEADFEEEYRRMVERTNQAFGLDKQETGVPGV